MRSFQGSNLTFLGVPDVAETVGDFFNVVFSVKIKSRPLLTKWPFLMAPTCSTVTCSLGQRPTKDKSNCEQTESGVKKSPPRSSFFRNNDCNSEIPGAARGGAPANGSQQSVLADSTTIAPPEVGVPLL